METGCSALSIFPIEELLPVITISVSIFIFVLALLRLVSRNDIVRRQEWYSLLWLSIAVNVWGFMAELNVRHISLYIYMACIVLLSGFACYILNLLHDYTGKDLYVILMKSTCLILLTITAGLGLFSHYAWYKTFFTLAIILLYIANTYFFVHYFIAGWGRYYRVMSILVATAALCIICDTAALLFPILNLSAFTQLGALILILVAGANTLDRSNLVALQDLNLELDRVREQFESETENMEDVVISLARTIDAKDKYTEGHIERVSQYSAFLGERMGLDESQLDTIRIGALIHDIGKICIDMTVLNKPGKLSSSEFEQIKQHPIVGEQICSPLKALRDAGVIVRCHHEKLDGSGYPDGLCGDSISMETRIVTIADIFDALTTQRSYRSALTAGEALGIIKYEADQGKLDTQLVDEFIAMLSEMEILPEYKPYNYDPCVV
ncbi:MAG TPA: HD domain-containing phosphohydrolase [Syntrophomonadaceae bacterium]|nr:HD domain-containing phosphohydrolase [Syntrophomonadaceae bacterium]